MNQIILLNHASTVNNERSEEYFEWKKQYEDETGKPLNVRVGIDMGESGLSSAAFAAAMMPR